MKLQTRQIEAFLKKPDAGVRAILVYGPDQGLVKERARILGLTIVPDLNDPFNAAHLTGESLESDPARFLDEVNAQSLMGGRRLVRITDPDAKFAVLLKDWLKSKPDDAALVVIEGGDLKPRDAIRKICEEADNAAALPCYIPDERDVTNFVRDLLREKNKTADPDALVWLGSVLKGDRDLIRMEIEKLCLYVADKPSAITLEEARESCGDIGEQSLDDLIYATFGRDPQKAMSSYGRLLREGTELIIIERSLQNHVRRLLQVRCLYDAGDTDWDGAMKSLQPPVFFKQADKFRAQAGRYSAVFLRKLLARLNELEAQTKKTGTPAEILVGDAVLKLAST